MKSTLLISLLLTLFSNSTFACVEAPDPIINLSIESAETYGFEIKIESDELCGSCERIEFKSPGHYKGGKLQSVRIETYNKNELVSYWKPFEFPILTNERTTTRYYFAILNNAVGYRHMIIWNYPGNDSPRCSDYYEFVYAHSQNKP